MPLDEDKGTALQRIIRADGLGVVAYAGDDRGDLPAFRVALASGGYALVVEGPDAAEEVARMPGVHFSGPGEFQQWLQQLDDALSRPDRYSQSCAIQRTLRQNREAPEKSPVLLS